jgi:hypothetical protein
MKTLALALVGVVSFGNVVFAQYEWNDVAPLRLTNFSFEIGGNSWNFPEEMYDTQEGDDGIIQLTSYDASQPRPDSWQALVIRRDPDSGGFQVRAEMSSSSPTGRSVGFDYAGPSLDALQLQGPMGGQISRWVMEPGILPQVPAGVTWFVNLPPYAHRLVDDNGNFVEPAQYWTNYHLVGPPGFDSWSPENSVPPTLNLYTNFYGENLQDWFSYRGINISLPEYLSSNNEGALGGAFVEQAQELNVGLEFNNGQWTVKE